MNYALSVNTGKTRTRIIELLSEPETLGTVSTRLLEITDVRNVAQLAGNTNSYRVVRVGIEVMPGSVIEFVVYGGKPASVINTRQELLKLPQTVQFRNLLGTPKVFWYRPVTGDTRNWQRLATDADKRGIWTGLQIWYAGANLLESGSSGFLGRILFDLELGGLMPILPT